MSDALDYLAQVRPEAAEHYLKFLKASGRRLDDKTRFLISVVTKVISGSEVGFRQYMPQALAAGATADEVVDAILCAFPAAGLTKVLNAVNWLLDMNLPEFAPENLGQQQSWHEVARMEEVPEARPVNVEAEGRSLFAFRQGQEVRVYDAHCPHQLNDISKLDIEDNKVVCLNHGWAFDVGTGKCLKGRRDLKSYDAKVDGDLILAYW